MGITRKGIKTIIYRWLIAILLISFILAAALGIFFQNSFSKRQAFTLLGEYIDDFENDWDLNAEIYSYVEEFFGEEVLSDRETYLQNNKLRGLITANFGSISEITVIDTDGIVVASSDPDMLGVNFFSDESLDAFRCLFEGEDYYAQNFDAASRDILYAGSPFYDGQGIILIGFDEAARRDHITSGLYNRVTNSRIGVTGYLLVCHPDKTVNGASRNLDIEEEVPFEKPELLPESDGEIQETITELYGQNVYVSALKEPDYYLVAVYPTDEADNLREKNNALFVGIFLIVFPILFIFLLKLINNHIISQVKDIHGSVKNIAAGNLDERANAGGSMEFCDLSRGINGTVEKLEDMIQQAKDQMAEDLMNARKIQNAAVPKIFPENDAFGIYASMDTAEDVGGDFYDFFMCGEDTLVVVMADVAGKGMPAALYMMRAKTLIRTFAMQGLPVEEVATKANVKLCEDASRDMFVTAWIGYLDLKTGIISYVHAGHTPPVLISDHEASLVKQKTGVEMPCDISRSCHAPQDNNHMVLGGLKKSKYIRQEIRLNPGDSIFLYTDGVSEANDISGKMYGEERLLNLIREKTGDIDATGKNDFCRAGCKMVYDDVQRFADGAKQFDDITMMWLRYVSGDE